jgi:hypothetical protein
MSQVSDLWFVRLPSGRVLRAHSTHTVRQYVDKGRIPTNSQVRRSAEEEWGRLDGFEEFADLVLTPGNGDRVHQETGRVAAQAGRIASRLDPARMQTVGVAAMIQDLLAALDSTLRRDKLLVAAIPALVGGLAVFLYRQGVLPVLLGGSAWSWVIAAAVLLLVGTVSTVFITRTTFVEVSSLRPARPKEQTAGLTRCTLWLFLVYVLVGGGATLALLGLRTLPSWVLTLPDSSLPSLARQAVAEVTAVAALLVQLLLWPVVGFTLLLGPVIVVEECSAWKALRIWCGLLWKNRARAYLYEAFAAAMGGALTLALALPVFLLVPATEEQLALTVGLTRAALYGLACTPLLTYLIVANVFIYLNLRYESEAP